MFYIYLNTSHYNNTIPIFPYKIYSMYPYFIDAVEFPYTFNTKK